MSVVLYTTECPKCKVLKTKLTDKLIPYTICDNKDVMIAKGFSTVPMLEVDGKTMNFLEATNWINGGIN